jgi:glucose-6-phosphate 1-dehydrogenase
MSGDNKLGIVVVGASGDLAQRKVIPALFALFCQNLLPPDFCLFGLARSDFTHEGFRKKIAENLTCRYVPGEADCASRTESFLNRCYYCQGSYASSDSFLDLFQLMRQVEGKGPVNRIFYMAIPPSVFMDVAKALGDSGLVACGDRDEWSRIVIEKPFGRDRHSSDTLVREMQKVFTEEATYRIDHYLGKEIVQNLMVLRFANLVFEPLWNRRYIRSVHIKWAEPVGVGQRGGYFDGYGIIRDVMQNHLLQILALLAMERPVKYEAGAIRDAKVKLLKAVSPLSLQDLVVGQYGTSQSGRQPAYEAETTVPPGSLTPTYASAVLKINNPRWEGVPFLIEAGKALDERINEVRIRFHDVPDHLWGNQQERVAANELVIRIQPDEAITLKIMNKVPGLGLELVSTDLNLRYHSAFNALIPDAYECLLLDVFEGDRNLFIRADELAAAWDVFTPVLHTLEASRIAPHLYPYGSSGPEAARQLAIRHGFTGNDVS